MTADAVVLSDLHLGADACRADLLDRFLADPPPAARVVLNGDVLESDEHRLRRRHWRVLSRLRKLSDAVELVWVRGNHDGDAAAVAALVGARWVDAYEFPSGPARVLCVHGDRFDDFLGRRPVASKVADRAYRLAQRVAPGLARTAKRGSKTFLRNCDRVRAGAAALAAARGCGLAVCGHTHRAELAPGYANAGCWTEPTCHYVTVSGGVAAVHRFEGE